MIFLILNKTQKKLKKQKERKKTSRKRISLIGTLFNWEFVLWRDISSRSHLTTWSGVQQVAVATGCQIERVPSVRHSFVFLPSYLSFSLPPFLPSFLLSIMISFLFPRFSFQLKRPTTLCPTARNSFLSRLAIFSCNLSYPPKNGYKSLLLFLYPSIILQKFVSHS